MIDAPENKTFFLKFYVFLFLNCNVLIAQKNRRFEKRSMFIILEIIYLIS